MTSDVREYLEGAEELGMAGEDSGMGGCHLTGLRDVIQGGGAGGYFIWVREVDSDPPTWDEPWEASRTGSPDGLRGDRQSYERMGAGNTHHWRQRWRRQCLRIWEIMYRRGRIKLRSTLQHVRF